MLALRFLYSLSTAHEVKAILVDGWTARLESSRPSLIIFIKL